MTATQHSFQDGKYSVRQVEVARQPVTARQLTATATSQNTVLTSTVRLISVRAVGADIRYSIGTSEQTATSSSHFIASGERLTLVVPSGANIGVLRNASTNGTLELTELD